MKRSFVVKVGLASMALLVGVCAFGPLALAQEEESGEAAAGDERLTVSTGQGLLALGAGIGAGLAVGIAGMGTGRAQAGVGAAGIGAITEKPEMLAQVLILFVIPETIIIFGFVIAILLLGNIQI